MNHQFKKMKMVAEKLITIESTVSSVSVLFIHSALFLVAHFLPSFPLLTLLSISAGVMLLVVGLGRACKKLLGVRGSAPAFVVINILYVWIVYLIVIRPGVSYKLDIVFNSELVILLLGLCRILSSDPGYVAYGYSNPEKLVADPLLDVETPLQESELASCETYKGCASNEESTLLQRIRFCRMCKVYVKGFDHHCPAFGNCIVAKSYTADKDVEKPSYSSTLAGSTMLFSLLQVLWQIVFLMWHLYCVCFNITTDEWINWKRYPEFQLVVQLQLGFDCSGQPASRTVFTNPYNHGILQNLKHFLKAKE
ncbi:probable protein S-acyltransferase 23 isoform X6 [Daucus carota subsp. sativus]|uniref:probable protein S-acyltransferase 23 isoform X6 n=1 Tax=Daucus carota subsp. sativus TaxID=79200 RepID=UPI003083E6AA